MVCTYQLTDTRLLLIISSISPLLYYIIMESLHVNINVGGSICKLCTHTVQRDQYEI